MTAELLVENVAVREQYMDRVEAKNFMKNNVTVFRKISNYSYKRVNILGGENYGRN